MSVIPAGLQMLMDRHNQGLLTNVGRNCVLSIEELPRGCRDDPFFLTQGIAIVILLEFDRPESPP